MKSLDNIVKSPIISVIITYYNLGKYVKDCVRSILSQTYTNFEIIIVNDCSDEANSKILNEISDEKIKIINLASNKGQLGAFLEGLSQAKGDFICMVDADDILLPNHLETLLYTHLHYNVALVSSQKGEINENGEVVSLQNVDNAEINYSEIENLLKTKETFKIERVKAPFGLWSWNPSSSAMFRKSALDILKYYPDIEFWKSGADKVIFSFLHLVGGSINIDAVTFLYRIHQGNNFATAQNSGCRKYLNEECVQKLIIWNKKLRLDAIKLFIKNKENLIKKCNKINYIKMFLRVIFCINLKICAKIIKTLAHKFFF